MTDRINSITVVLNKDLREEDAQPIIDAILQFKGVCAAEGNVTDPNAYIAESRAFNAIHENLMAALYNQNPNV